MFYLHWKQKQKVKKYFQNRKWIFAHHIFSLRDFLKYSAYTHESF